MTYFEETSNLVNQTNPVNLWSLLLLLFIYKNNVVFIITAQGQADYSAAWAAYYQQLYQQQAVMAAGQAPGIRIM